MNSLTPLPDDKVRLTSDAPAPAGLRVTITPRSIWLTVGIVLMIVGVIYLGVMAIGTLVLLFLAIIVGEAIRPFVMWMMRYRIPRPVGVLLIYLTAFAVLGVLLWFLLNPLVQQIRVLSANVPGYITQLETWVTQIAQAVNAQGALQEALTSLSRSLAGLLQSSAPTLISLPFTVVAGIFSSIISVVVVLTMALFWLLSSAKLKPFVVSLFPVGMQDQVTDVIAELGRTLGGYVQGTAIGMVLIGTLTSVGLFILGTPYALLLGVLAGLLELLPYIGPWVSGMAAVLVALIAVDPLKAIEVAILFVVIQQVEGSVMQPLVMSRAVHVDPLLVIVAVLIGIELMGIVGAILAVPTAAMIQVLMVRVVAPAIRRTVARVESSHVTVPPVPPPAAPPVPQQSEPVSEPSAAES